MTIEAFLACVRKRGEKERTLTDWRYCGLSLPDGSSPSGFADFFGPFGM